MIWQRFLVMAVLSTTMVLCQGDYDDTGRILWPEITCHKGYVESDDDNFFPMTNDLCRNYGTQNPNMPQDVPEFITGVCWKFCVLWHLGFLVEDYKDENGNYTEDEVTYRLSNSTGGYLDKLGNEWNGLTLTRKGYQTCSKLFEQVFNVEKEGCNTQRANEVYNCINDALKC